MHAKIVFNVIIINRESIIINGNIDHQLNDIFIMLIKIFRMTYHDKLPFSCAEAISKYTPTIQPKLHELSI